MKTSTRAIIKAALAGDDSVAEGHRKKIIYVLNHPEAATTDGNGSRQLISLSKAAKAFDISTRTLRRMVDRGELSAHRFTSHTLRIDVADLEAVRADKRIPNQERNERGRFAKPEPEGISPE